LNTSDATLEVCANDGHCDSSDIGAYMRCYRYTYSLGRPYIQAYEEPCKHWTKLSDVL